MKWWNRSNCSVVLTISYVLHLLLWVGERNLFSSALGKEGGFVYSNCYKVQTWGSFYGLSGHRFRRWTTTFGVRRKNAFSTSIANQRNERHNGFRNSKLKRRKMIGCLSWERVFQFLCRLWLTAQYVMVEDIHMCNICGRFDIHSVSWWSDPVFLFSSFDGQSLIVGKESSHRTKKVVQEVKYKLRLNARQKGHVLVLNEALTVMSVAVRCYRAYYGLQRGKFWQGEMEYGLPVNEKSLP